MSSTTSLFIGLCVFFRKHLALLQWKTLKQGVVVKTREEVYLNRDYLIPNFHIGRYIIYGKCPKIRVVGWCALCCSFQRDRLDMNEIDFS